MKETKIIVLSDREHLLRRPQMYIGGMTRIESEELILEDGKLKRGKTSYVPALIKIINEAIDNSLDEATKTDFKYGNKIKVSISDHEVQVEDNGRGIPIKKAEGSDTLMPVLAFCNARAGSNFEDSSSSSIGTHGLGIKATNIFSKRFEAETCDGKNKLVLLCTDNMENISFSSRKHQGNFTKVTFQPDLERFGLEEIDEVHKNSIYQRMLFLSMTYPKIKFYFNGSKVSVTNEKQFMNLFSEKYELFSGENWFIGVYPNEEEDFSFFSYVNGLYLKRGGAHVDFFSTEFSYKLRNLLVKKYKTIKPGDVKNKISLVVFFKNFPNMKFDSQTKETLTNSLSEIKDFLNLSQDDLLAMTKKISKNEDITEPIIELFKLKEEFKKRQALKNLSNNRKRIVSDTYYPPIGKKKYLFLTEGFSATSSMLRSLGRKDIAYYSLKGKPLNTYEVHISKMIKNKEFKEIVDILNINLLDHNTDMEYEKVVFLADQDSDGQHIKALLLTFFNKFTPKMVEDGRICMMNTPLLVGFDSKGEPKEWFFSLDDYNEQMECNREKLSKLDMKYYKGLGSFNHGDLQKIIKKVGTMEDLFIVFDKDLDSEKSIKEWMSSADSSVRKESLQNRAFNISAI